MRSIIAELCRSRKLILNLSVRNFKTAYFGSVLGITWVLIEPLIYVLLIWFFFTKALKFSPPDGYPFVPWLMAAISLWFFFANALPTSAGTFKSHSFLMHRPDFNMAVLPFVNIITAIYIHAIFLVMLMVMLLLNDIPFTLYWFQAIYYLFATSVLLLGLAWITASLSLFIKDVNNLVAVVLQVGFWVSPIFWSPQSYPQRFRFLLDLNPLTYLMEGYRKSFLYGQPIWNDVNGFVYFWSFTLVILLIGVYTYKKLRPHFGDVI